MLINKNEELIVVMASFTMFEIVIEVDAKLVYDGSPIENAGLAGIKGLIPTLSHMNYTMIS